MVEGMTDTEWTAEKHAKVKLQLASQVVSPSDWYCARLDEALREIGRLQKIIEDAEG